MDDFISRESAIKAVCDCSTHTCKMGECFNSCNEAKALSSIPAADVVEVRHAHWILHVSDIYPADSTMECSSCNEEQLIGTSDSYCPNCGAKMDGGQDE